MKQTVICNDLIGARYTKTEHDSGLTVYLYEDHSFNSCYALYGTNFGSYDSCFSTEDGITEVPDGIAHFLEHKLFESEEQDAFQRFAKTGANSNAYTSFDKTCYLFSASQNIHESLEILLDFVNHPYFTEKSVAKEQGIIGQEITMYDDNPGWQVLFSTLSGLFMESPVKKDIAGTIETISHITPELLYKCYDTFYAPENMVLAVAGNFDSEEVIRLVDKYVKPGHSIDKVKRIIPKETDRIAADHITKKMEVSFPMFTIGYKEVPAADELKEKTAAQAELLQEILFSDSTDLYCSLYNDGLINGSFGTEVFAGQRGREYFANLIEGESQQAEAVFDRITEYIAIKKKTGITPEELQRAKKVLIGADVRSYNNPEAIASRLVSAHFGGITLFDQRRLIEEITLEEINEALQNQYRPDHAVFTVIEPKTTGDVKQ